MRKNQPFSDPSQGHRGGGNSWIAASTRRTVAPGRGRSSRCCNDTALPRAPPPGHRGVEQQQLDCRRCRQRWERRRFAVRSAAGASCRTAAPRRGRGFGQAPWPKPAVARATFPRCPPARRHTLRAAGLPRRREHRRHCHAVATVGSDIDCAPHSNAANCSSRRCKVSRFFGFREIEKHAQGV